MRFDWFDAATLSYQLGKAFVAELKSGAPVK
jgi:hypothetical protein